MRDGTSPEYFAIGVIVIILILYFSLKENKDAIDEGRGDEDSSEIMWGPDAGKTYSHKEDYDSGKITFGIFILALLYYILTK
mgnify:CR=1 FL=1|tara:strand:+ start:353 stop:598 length:246 start_codon:yes stop_codon:yes gene_type:complete